MPIHKGRRPGTYRVILWSRNRSREWIVEGTKRDAESFEARKRLELSAGDEREARSVLRFSTFCAERYKPHAVAHLKPSTWLKVRRYQLATLLEHFGDLRLTDFSVSRVEAYKHARSAEVSAASVNNELRVLGTILRWASSLGIAVTVPKMKRLPIRGAPRAKAWTPEEVNDLYTAATAHAPDLLPLLVFLANTGCRKGEALAAEWAWIDLDARLVRIPSNDVWQPKNGKPREVPISDALLPFLKGPRRHERWLFPNRDGGRFVDFPKDVWWRLTEDAGLSGGPHQFRHTFASLFLQREPDLGLLAEILGHSHTRITELYTHLLPNHLARARNAVSIAPRAETVARAMAATKTTDEIRARKK